MTDTKHAAGQKCRYGIHYSSEEDRKHCFVCGIALSGISPVTNSAASYPGIPADLARQIAEERRELMDALRELYTVAQDRCKLPNKLCDRIDAILAREGGDGNHSDIPW